MPKSIENDNSQIDIMNHEREMIISLARGLSDIDPFADRVLRYLELAKKLEKPNHINIFFGKEVNMNR